MLAGEQDSEDFGHCTFWQGTSLHAACLKVTLVQLLQMSVILLVWWLPDCFSFVTGPQHTQPTNSLLCQSARALDIRAQLQQQQHSRLEPPTQHRKQPQQQQQLDQ